MYVPAHFELSNIEALHEFIRENSFGILFTQHQGSAQASHLPFTLQVTSDQQAVLLGHFAKANVHWHSLNSVTEVLVVFQGPHGYISPSWFKTPHQVPTWNYAAVHVYGQPTLIDDQSRLVSVLERLVGENESVYQQPWTMGQAKPVLKTLLTQIVGFEIEINRIEGKLKLSQNKTPQDRTGAADVLEQSSDTQQQQLAQLMRQTIKS